MKSKLLFTVFGLAFLAGLVFLLFYFSPLASQNNSQVIKIGHKKNDTVPEKVKLCIQPFGDFDTALTKKIEKEILKCYDVETITGNPCVLPDSAYYAPGDIFSASMLLDFLHIINAGHCKKIIGLTDRHIYHAKENYPYWGIFGLSDIGDSACVVSSYRIKLHSPPDKFYSRLINTVIHELGHAFGLDHCPDKTCVMVAWYGSWDNIDKMNNAFCEDCKKKIADILKSK